MLVGDVLLLRVAERPSLVALNAGAGQIHQRAILVSERCPLGCRTHFELDAKENTTQETESGICN
jgi:hypothetical protein